jgi:N-acetyl-anhydromuramyl-L-alanine amidase AmpD
VKRLLCVLAVILSFMTATPVGSARPLVVRGSVPTRYDLKRLKPPVVWKRIPYGRTRRHQMAAYSKRHYGTWSWHLSSPKVIVEHYTDGLTWQGAWNTFAANTKHNGEYPGTCAHFLIDRDGTIRQLVPLDIRCRHAVGMNYTAIGIEHVGTSDHMVLSNRRQMHSSLRLTTYLMARFGINIGNVIGHRETLRSPYHHELYPSWRCLVHADFPHWAMHKYRTRLREVLAAHGVKAGKGPVWVDSGC